MKPTCQTVLWTLSEEGEVAGLGRVRRRFFAVGDAASELLPLIGAARAETAAGEDGGDAGGDGGGTISGATTQDVRDFSPSALHVQTNKHTRKRWQGGRQHDLRS